MTAGDVIDIVAGWKQRASTSGSTAAGPWTQPWRRGPVLTTISIWSSSSATWSLQQSLGERGYVLVGGGAPKSFELTDDDGRQVDVHPVVFDDSGDGVYRLERDEDWVYPAAGFAGKGRVLGRLVHCLTPEAQLLCHTGYEPHRGSYDDVWAAESRVRHPRSGEYRRARESYPVRAG